VLFGLFFGPLVLSYRLVLRRRMWCWDVGGGSKWNEMGYFKKNLPGAQMMRLNVLLGLFSGWQMLCGVML